jgi:hypothetical protein
MHFRFPGISTFCEEARHDKQSGARFKNCVALVLSLGLLLFCGSLSAQNVPATFYGRIDSPFSIGEKFTIAGDLNGDGKLALVGRGPGLTNNTIGVMLGNGDGTFQAPVLYTLGNAAGAGQLGDFNNDGIPDLVIVTPSDGSISVLLGNGDGTFQTPKTTIIGSQSDPQDVAVGDFNADGNLDVALPIALPQSGQYGVAVLLGNGNGTFGSPAYYVTQGVGRLIASADFNNDGKLDLVTANSLGAISVLLGTDDGTFQTALNGQVLNGVATALSVADFNHDGKLDVAMGESLALGNGNGTFQSPVEVANGMTVTATGDFNGDGVADLLATATTVEQTVTTTVLLGRGEAPFSNRTVSSYWKRTRLLGIPTEMESWTS